MQAKKRTQKANRQKRQQKVDQQQKEENVLTINHDMQVANNIGTVAGNNWEEQVTAQCVMTGDTTADGGSMQLEQPVDNNTVVNTNMDVK